MTALTTIILFIGIMLVFTLGMLTGAALAGLSYAKRQEERDRKMPPGDVRIELVEQVAEDQIRSTRH